MTKPFCVLTAVLTVALAGCRQASDKGRTKVELVLYCGAAFGRPCGGNRCVRGQTQTSIVADYAGSEVSAVEDQAIRAATCICPATGTMSNRLDRPG